MEIVKVEHLHKTFSGEKTSAINDVSFSLNAGEKLALTGPDGSGKTTLLRLMAGLLLTDEACTKSGIEPILINGLSPDKDYFEIKKIIGYMPQKFGLYEDLTVLENLQFYAGLKNIDKKEQKALFDELLEFAGLKKFTERLTGALSGGMKQKLGLSCVLLARPMVLLLDEPTVGVDPVSRLDLIKITDKLAEKDKISVIWATSYLDEARFFDKVLLLNSGKKIFSGTVNATKKAMEGLVFHVGKENSTRKLLYEFSKTDGVSDCTIEGDEIRIVFEDKGAAQKFPYAKVRTEPVFEDFVMCSLKTKKLELADFSHDIEENPPENIAIQANNLTKKYGNFTAADNISFSVKKGEIFGLLGPNGAGKSTTFKMLCSLIAPTSGSSRVFGIDINKNPIEAKKHFGYMAQRFSLFGNLSVRQNLEFFMGVFGVEKSVEEVILGYDLEKYLQRNAADLPLGYKQRLSLLCALVHNPPVLFLDEPTSGVDPISRREFWMRINNLAGHKTSVLVTTHFMDEAQFCDRVAFVFGGKILVEGTPENLKHSVKSAKLPNPTMEETFIEIIRRAS